MAATRAATRPPLLLPGAAPPLLLGALVLMKLLPPALIWFGVLEVEAVLESASQSTAVPGCCVENALTSIHKPPADDERACLCTEAVSLLPPLVGMPSMLLCWELVQLSEAAGAALLGIIASIAELSRCSD